MPPRPPRCGRIVGLVALAALLPACGGEEPPAEPEPQSRALQTAYTCAAGCGGALGSAVLPGPGGPVSLTAWSNSPQLGTDYDCDPTACAGSSPVTARNGQPAYGCPWQCVELVNRYFQGTWRTPKISADAGAGFCQFAASSSLPQYWVYGQYGASAAGHAPIAGDVLVWAGHVAIATNAVSAGGAGTIGVVEQNATCSGIDAVSWSGSMFGAKYGLAPLCWVHVLANTGATGPLCPTGSNWHLAGDYCGGAPGMQNADGNTLYSCASAGGAASAKQVCSFGCQQMPPGQNDRCAPPPPPLPDAGTPADAGTITDAGMIADAGTISDAGTATDACAAGAVPDACAAAPGTPSAREDPPPAAISAGCASGGAAWTSWLGLLALAARRRHSPFARRCRTLPPPAPQISPPPTGASASGNRASC